MSLAAERIQAILREIDVDPGMAEGKSANEIAKILLREETADCEQANCDVHTVENSVSVSAPICDLNSVDQNLSQVNNKWVVAYFRHLDNHGRKYEKLVIFAKRVVRKLIKFVVEPIAKDIHEFHIVVTNTLNAMRNNDVVFDAHIRAIEGGNVQRDSQIHSLMGSVSENTNSLQGITQKNTEIESRIQEVEQGALQRESKIVALMDSLAERERVAAKLNEQLIYLNDRAMEIEELRKKLTAIEEAQAKKKEAEDYLDIDYFEFEKHFRGTRSQVKEMQKIYLHHFTDGKNVLDLGSGRGEFLELLTENQIPVTCVDMYAPFVDYCRTRGYNVVCEDAVQFLQKQKDASYDGIFAAQLAEHLPTQALVNLCRESYRVLEEGKTLIIETPNPTCMSTYMNSFYLDPTHVKPVHPKTLEYFLKKVGFSKVEVIYTQQSKVGYRFPLLDTPAANLAEFNDGINFMSDIIFGSQDYAIIAVK